MLTQLQQQTAQSLSRMRPAGDPKVLFNQIDWAVWSSCLRAMREGSGVQTTDFEEFRRLAYGGKPASSPQAKIVPGVTWEGKYAK